MVVRAKAANGATGVPLALIYFRVSTAAQEREGVSLDVQLRECRRYVAERGWIIDSEYTDTLSGRRTDRPGYQRLLSRARELHADRRNAVVVVAALDRFGRKMLERVRSREELKTLGIPTHSVREGGEVSDLVANVLTSVAAEESERTAVRVRNTWRAVAERGFYKTSAMLPWGYRSRPRTEAERSDGAPKTVLEPDPVAAPYVAELFKRAASGESTWSLARWAAALPAEIRGRWVCGRGATPDRELTRRSVTKILRNDVYVARAPARWQPLVDEVTWAAVQRRLDATRDAPRAKRADYRLSGFLACPECGGRMTGEQSGPYRRYRCQAWRTGGHSTAVCNISVDAGQVEGLLLSEVAQRAGAFVTIDRRRLERAWQQLAMPDSRMDAAKQIRRLEQQAETARRRITSATQLFVDGQIGKAAYDGMVASEQAALNTAETELARLRKVPEPAAALPPLAQVLDALGNWSAALESTDVLIVRDILAVMVERITPRRLSRGKYGVDITWTALGATLGNLAAAA